jgi:hypothetical protein
MSMHNLAHSYADLGRVADAVKLSEETLALFKAKLGPDHRDTLASMNNVAIFYHLAGRPQQGHELLEELVRLSATKLGPEDELTLRSMLSLSNSYYYLARNAESIKLQEEVLRLRKARLGREHLDTLFTMEDLAVNYGAVGRMQEAIKLCEETLEVMKRKLGPEHPRTLVLMQNLAGYYACFLQPADALSLVEQVMTVRQRRLHNDAGNIVDQLNLAWNYKLLGMAEQARYDHAAAAKAYAVSVEMFEKLERAGELKHKWFHGQLDESRWRLGLCRKTERAVHDLDFALSQPAEEVPKLLDWRVRFLLHRHELAAAVESAAKAEQLTGQNANRLYDAACLYAQCAAAAKGAHAREYGDEAMSLLGQAVANGYKYRAHLASDPDLACLRDRDDFKKLLVQLQEKE